MKLRVVLVNPEIPQNTGNIGRLVSAVGAELLLVGKLGFSLDEKSVRRAGMDYWKCVQVSHLEDINQFYETVDENTFFISTRGEQLYTEIPLDTSGTNTDRTNDAKTVGFNTNDAKLADDNANDDKIVHDKIAGANMNYDKIVHDKLADDKIDIVFGSEGLGFPQTVYTNYSDKLYRIPMLEGKRSLNLANSASIVVYDILRRLSFKNLI